MNHDVLDINTGILKMNEIMPFAATCMQLEMIIPTEVRKKKTNTIR